MKIYVISKYGNGNCCIITKSTEDAQKYLTEVGCDINYADVQWQLYSRGAFSTCFNSEVYYIDPINLKDHASLRFLYTEMMRKGNVALWKKK